LEFESVASQTTGNATHPISLPTGGVVNAPALPAHLVVAILQQLGASGFAMTYDSRKQLS
jgi:hypothetical protein